jgi:hypothetical protein
MTLPLAILKSTQKMLEASMQEKIACQFLEIPQRTVLNQQNSNPYFFGSIGFFCYHLSRIESIEICNSGTFFLIIAMGKAI